MSSPQINFKRFEKKYVLSLQQYTQISEALKGYTRQDKFPKCTILSLYYDTPDFALIRASLEKPAYKEKLRLRAYGVPQADDRVFVELKKKFDGIVYKRRITLPFHLAQRYLKNEYRPQDGQIVRELDFFMTRYTINPAALLCYDREALAGTEDPNVRITFDRNIRARSERLNLAEGDWGLQILPPEMVLMELKLPQTAPLWLARLLSEQRIYPGHFSKYGAFYRQYLAPDAEKKPIGKDVFHCA